MNVTQISIGRFHHFHLARQMERLGVLSKIYTGYPYIKLKDEAGIPKHKIVSFPWFYTPYMLRHKIGLHKFIPLNKEWEWQSVRTLDNFVATQIKSPNVLIALSGSGLSSGKKMLSLGGKYICDRGSSHIAFQNEILLDEYIRWGFKFKGIDKRIIAKEEEEYAVSNLISVPSEFVRKSFIDHGVDEKKVIKIPYGARLDRFFKIDSPSATNFRVLWVGAVSLRKGFMYALKAFQEFKHPKKEFCVIGSMTPEIKQLISRENIDSVYFLGNIDNSKLPHYYSTSHVFVLPSIEEGLAMVQGEAMACGCPIIATKHTGAEDIFKQDETGFIVPLRSIDAIREGYEKLADNTYLREEMSRKAIDAVRVLSGWNKYGEQMLSLINSLEIN